MSDINFLCSIKNTLKTYERISLIAEGILLLGRLYISLKSMRQSINSSMINLFSIGYLINLFFIRRDHQSSAIYRLASTKYLSTGLNCLLFYLHFLFLSF